MTDLDHYLRPRPLLPAFAWLFPALLAAGSVALAIAGFVESDKLVQLNARNSDLLAMRLVKPAPKPRPVDVEQQKRWVELRQERDFPWQKVFASVERADRPNIELLEFKPDKRNHLVVLRGEARDAAALTAYLETLASDADLDKVYLVHRQNAIREKLQTVTFEIKATLHE